MNLKAIILLLAISPLLGQDRSLVFTTGSPSGNDGFMIQHDGSTGQSVSDRFYIESDMVLEALKIYASNISEPANATIILQTDNNNSPGEEIYSWQVDISEETHGNNYFLIITTDLCIYLDEDNFYWLTIHANDSDSQITWFYSNNATFPYSTSNDLGSNWAETTTGQCGALSIWAEYIYEPEIDDLIGDINGDGAVNILDIVMLANAALSGDNLPDGDINGDGSINILDIVGLVNIILNGAPAEQLSEWLYEDINENSDFFAQIIGPEVFNGNVSLYYFGKAG